MNAAGCATRIADLLATYCPDSVEYKQLGDVVTITRGKRVVRNQLFAVGQYPVYQNSLTPLGYYTESNVAGGTAFVIVAGAAGDIGYSEVDFWAADDCFAMIGTSGIMNRYIYHWLLLNQYYIRSKVRKASIPRLSRNVLEDMQIPVPPLDVQREIVRILDTFTALTTELQTERTQRLRQYEYYRDMLLSEEYLTQLSATLGKGQSSRHIEVNSYPLCELFHIKNGYTPSKRVKSYWQNGTVPWFRMEDIREHGHILDDAIQKVHPDGVKGELFPANSIMMATTATIGVHALVQVDYLANQRFTNFALKPEYAGAVDMKYVYYYFYLIDDWAKRNVNASSFASVKMEELKAYRIPVPPLAVQRQVVGILDKLETLCRDVTAGLPREIALRERQYEYYRERLLTFPRQRAQEGGVR